MLYNIHVRIRITQIAISAAEVNKKKKKKTLIMYKCIFFNKML